MNFALKESVQLIHQYERSIFPDLKKCLFWLITCITHVSSVSFLTTQTCALFNVTETLQAILWTGYRAVLTVKS